MDRTNAATEIHSPLYSPGNQTLAAMRYCGRFGAVSKTVVRLSAHEGSNPSPSASQAGISYESRVPACRCAFTVEDLNVMRRVADPPQAAKRSAADLGPVAPRAWQQSVHVVPRPRRRDDRALLRHRPDGRPPVRRVAGRSEADEPGGQAAACAVHRHRLPAGETTAGRPPYAMRPDRTPTASGRT